MAVVLDYSSVVLFRAPWIIPVTSKIIKDGVIAVSGSRILEVGAWSDLSQQYAGSKIVTCSGVLLPALINSHIHLELSVFGPVPQKNTDSTMCDWVRTLMQKRMATEFSEEDIQAAAEKCAQEQYASGVALLLDTGNTPLPIRSGNIPKIYSLLEFLGPSANATTTVLSILDTLPETTRITGHAPYSTSPKLLKSIKDRTVKQGTLFSLHVAENPDEEVLLLQGAGCFYEFLQERDAIDGTFPLPSNRYQSVVDYLYKNHILDTKTICIHCVYVSEKDIQIIAKAKSHVCLCPSSNAFLGFDEAPLEKFLMHGLLPALGTDSIASNPKLNMWHEIALIRKEHPTVSPDIVVAMATIAGARAMGMEKEYGSLEPGKTSDFIAVEDKKIATVGSEKEVLDLLTSQGIPEKVIRFS